MQIYRRLSAGGENLSIDLSDTHYAASKGHLFAVVLDPFFIPGDGLSSHRGPNGRASSSASRRSLPTAQPNTTAWRVACCNATRSVFQGWILQFSHALFKPTSTRQALAPRGEQNGIPPRASSPSRHRQKRPDAAVGRKLFRDNAFSGKKLFVRPTFPRNVV